MPFKINSIQNKNDFPPFVLCTLGLNSVFMKNICANKNCFHPTI